MHTYPEVHITVENSKSIPQLAGFDIETVEQQRNLTEMKRTYTLKLFAGGAEAKELFAWLGRELAAIVKQSYLKALTSRRSLR
jgi:hypothetical protein